MAFFKNNSVHYQIIGSGFAMGPFETKECNDDKLIEKLSRNSSITEVKEDKEESAPKKKKKKD